MEIEVSKGPTYIVACKVARLTIDGINKAIVGYWKTKMELRNITALFGH